MCWGSATRNSRNQTDGWGGTGASAGACDEADLRHGDGVGRVGDCCAGGGGARGDRDDGAGSDTGAGNAGWSHCRNQGDG